MVATLFQRSRCRCRARPGAELVEVSDRRGRRRLARRCWACGGACGSRPVPNRPRLTLLGYLMALEDAGVRWYRRGGRLAFTPALPAALMGDFPHHGALMLSMSSPASAATDQGAPP